MVVPRTMRPKWVAGQPLVFWSPSFLKPGQRYGNVTARPVPGRRRYG